MRNQSKEFKEKAKIIDPHKSYTPQEALELVKQVSYEKFDATIELHIRTGIDARKSDQSIRGTVVLPSGTGNTKRIAVFADGEKATEAKDAGADIVGGQELITEIKQSGKIDFDIALATPDLMKYLAGIAKILGPRGLMPSPKNETVTVNIKQAIHEVKKGKISFKNDDSGNVHVIVGKKSFSTEQLLENYIAFMEVFRKARPSSAKGIYILAISTSSTMGPSVKIQTS